MNYALHGLTTGLICSPTSLYQLLQLTPTIRIPISTFARLSLKAAPIHCG